MAVMDLIDDARDGELYYYSTTAGVDKFQFCYQTYVIEKLSRASVERIGLPIKEGLEYITYAGTAGLMAQNHFSSVLRKKCPLDFMPNVQVYTDILLTPVLCGLFVEDATTTLIYPKKYKVFLCLNDSLLYVFNRRPSRSDIDNRSIGALFCEILLCRVT